MEKYLTEKHYLRNEFGKRLIFSFLGIFIFYNLLILCLKYFGDYKFSIDQPTVFFSMLITSYFCYLATRKNFIFWPILSIISIGLYILVTYLSLVTIHKSMIPCLFYIPVILMFLVQSSILKAFSISIITLIFCFFMPSIAEFFDLSQPLEISPHQKKVLGYLSYIIQAIVIYLSMLILYYHNALSKIDNIIETTKIMSSQQTDTDTKENSTPMQKLYEKIIVFVEEKKPFTDPEFSIQTLALKLKSNPTYVSRALNHEGGKSFTEFVQEYRIEMVKKEIESRNGRTLEEIYKRAGFKQQTTFNRRFKDITGSTPSEYFQKIHDL